MVLEDPLAVALQLVEVLDQLEIPYLVGGSLASSLHGEPRATYDVDLVIDLRLAQVPQLVAALGDAYYADEDMIREAVREHRCCNIIHLASMLKLDLFILGPDPLQQQEMQRRVTFDIPDAATPLNVASAEDIILQKLHWYRLGDRVSERQWNDACGVLRVQGDRLDRPYLRRWADAAGLRELLDELLASG